MSDTSAKNEIAKLNYLEGGSKRVSEEISHVKYDGSIDLTIQDFLAWSEFKEDNFTFQSSPAEFKFDQTTFKFQLQLYLHNKTDDSIGLFLNSLNSGELNIAWELIAIDSSGNIFAQITGTKKFKPKSGGWGSETFVSKKRLKENSKLLLNGALKLKCNFSIYASEVSHIQEENPKRFKGTASLSTDLSGLWQDQYLHDFNIKCEGKTFPCHKAILASRSEVFKAMLTQEESLERIKNEVEIKDCSHEALESFLEFLYTDGLSDKTPYQSTELLVLADKYNIPSLKDKCELALSEILTNFNAIQLLSTAFLISAKTLLKNAAIYITKNHRELVGSDDWAEMVKTNPQAMDAIFKVSL
jgi:speckle-type POZ protein